MPLSVVRILPIVTHGKRGIRSGEAVFSDGKTIPFRVSAIDPTDARLVGGSVLPEHEDALRAWWAEHHGDAET
jgi:hypothetical protein